MNIGAPDVITAPRAPLHGTDDVAVSAHDTCAGSMADAMEDRAGGAQLPPTDGAAACCVLVRWPRPADTAADAGVAGVGSCLFCVGERIGHVWDVRWCVSSQQSRADTLPCCCAL